MNKFQLVVADPPWFFFDELKMSEVKRGASSQYSVLRNEDIKNLPIKDLTAENAVLALWVPSSLLQEGLDTMKAWGFRQTQTHIWVKTKNEPLADVIKALISFAKKFTIDNNLADTIAETLKRFSLDEVLAFGMGRLFRQTHEVCLIGIKGKPYKLLKNKSQRSVHFDFNKKHSAKSEKLQDRLELMFPGMTYLELFARRQRKGWVCLGNEAPMTINEDIRDSLNKLINST